MKDLAIAAVLSVFFAAVASGIVVHFVFPLIFGGVKP